MNLTAFVWLLLSLIWGTTWLFIKLGLDVLPPFTFAGLRFLLASLLLAIMLVARKKRTPQSRRDWLLIAWTGFFTFTMNYGLVFWGERHISSGLTAIFYSTFPLFGLFIAHYKLSNEPITWGKASGVVLGIAGVALVFFDQVITFNPAAIAGSTAIILAALGSAYASVQIKASGSHIDPLLLTVGQMVVGFIPLLGLGLWLEGNPLQYDWNLSIVGVLAYLAFVGSALTFVLVYWLMQRMAVTKTQLIPLASTLVAVILGKLLMHENFGWRVLVGGVGILLGLVLAVRDSRKRRAG